MNDLVPSGYIAGKFNVCPNTVRRWVRDGVLKPVSATMGGAKRRGHLRFKKSEVDKLWADNVEKSLGSIKGPTASGTSTGTTTCLVKPVDRVWTPATTKKPGVPSRTSSGTAQRAPDMSAMLE